MTSYTYFEIWDALGCGSAVRRCDLDADPSALSEILVGGEWQSAGVTVGEARTMISFGAAHIVDAPKCAVKAEDAEAAPEWVYFVYRGHTGTIRRYDAKKAGDHTAPTEYKTHGGVWEQSAMTMFGVEACIKQGGVIITNEFGSALAKAPEERQEEGVVTDPATGTTYKLDSHGAILSRAPHSASFYAAPCNVHIIEAVIRLGLVGVKP